MADALLEATEVRAQYGQVPVLHGIDFRIDEGEIVVILGANGAGKTTTIRAICGMVNTHGSIRLGSTELVGKRPEQVARLGVAHVPQGRGTFPELSVTDNLAAGAYLRRDRAESRATWRGGSRRSPCSVAAVTNSRASCPAASNRCSRSRAR